MELALLNTSFLTTVENAVCTLSRIIQPLKTITTLGRLLERCPDIHLALLFGSLAKGAVCRDGDIDLAVGTDQPLDD